MTRSVFVFLNEGGRGINHAVAVDADRVEQLDHSNSNFIDRVSGQVIAVLAGEDVSTWCVELPDLPDSKLMQVLPVQLEDSKAIAADGDHCALLAKLKDGKRLVACVASTAMDNARHTLEINGLVAECLVPDYLLLPRNASNIVTAMQPNKERFIVRLSDGTGFAGDKLLTQQIAGDVKAETFDFSYVRMAAPAECNLLQGRYRPKLAIATHLPLLRRSAALAASVLVLLTSSLVLTASQNNAEVEKLQQQSRRLFQETFPEVTRVVDMQVQAKRSVATLRAADGGAFLRISEAIYKHMAAAESIVLEGVRFNEPQKAFFLTVSFASFPESDLFLRQLRGDGLRVSEGGSRQDDGRVITDVTIEVQP